MNNLSTVLKAQSLSARNLSELSNSIRLRVPAVSIEGQGGGFYRLTTDVVMRIIAVCGGWDITSGEVFLSDSNLRRVVDLTNAVLSHRALSTWIDGNTYLEADLLAHIERVLVAQNAAEYASNLVRGFNASFIQGGEGSGLRLIRRNGEVVPWSAAKVVSSVSRALVATGLDAGHQGFPARVADAAENRIRRAGTVHVRMEEVQDNVEQAMVQIWASLHPGDLVLWSAIRGYMTYRSRKDAERE